MTDLVYDSGALIAAEQDARALWLIHQRALQRGVVPIVPAETASPRMRNLDRLLAGCEIEPIEMGPATAAAGLRHATIGATVVDAIVVETSLRRQGAVVTSDRLDLEALADSVDRGLAVFDI